MRGRSVLLWILAVVITLFSAAWQRATGPTHPYRAKAELAGVKYSFSLPRSHGGSGDQEIRLHVPDTTVTGELVWRRYPTNEPWVQQPLEREGEFLVGRLPHQPPAGKLEYEIQLRKGQSTARLSHRPVIIRFSGHVPAGALIPHILAMFLFMLFSNRAGLGALVGEKKTTAYGWTGFVLLIVGGFIFGPVVQHYAFGQWWTGFPFGYDLTDNKTLIAAIVWLYALFRSRGEKQARGAIVFAAFVTFVAFLIPHSAWGSELNWEELPESPPSP